MKHTTAREEFDVAGRRSFKTCDREVAVYLENLAKFYDNAAKQPGVIHDLGFNAWPKRY